MVQHYEVVQAVLVEIDNDRFGSQGPILVGPNQLSQRGGYVRSEPSVRLGQTR